MENSCILNPFPDGWYHLIASADLKRGDVVNRKLGGRDLVLFRTASGEVAALDAYCPHLGAHMGHGGRVEGESIRCPFHGLRFSPKGRCVATAYEGNPEFRRDVATWPVRETNGLVLVYFSAGGEAPAWEVPALDERGWTPLMTKSLELRAHPQETSENSVDVGHFASVHDYSDVSLVGKPEVNGPHLRTRYTALRRFPLLPRSLRDRVRMRLDYDVDVWGLGYSLVRIQLPQLGISVRFWVLSTHTDGQQVALTLAASAPWRLVARTDGWTRFVPWSLVARIVRRSILSQAIGDVLQDSPIWANKVYLDPPVLLKGDGPIGPYRRYVRQFYPGDSTDRENVDAQPENGNGMSRVSGETLSGWMAATPSDRSA